MDAFGTIKLPVKMVGDGPLGLGAEVCNYLKVPDSMPNA